MFIRVAFLLIVCCIYLANTQNTNQIKQLSYDCTRQCDSHFSGRSCWDKTLQYFANDLLQSIVLYKNAMAQTGNKDQTYFEEYLQSAIESYLKNDGGTMDAFGNANPVNVTLQVFSRLLIAADKLPSVYFSKCPQTCQMSTLTIWQALYGGFMGLSLVTIIFLIAFVSILKIQYHKLNQKLSSSTATSS